MPKSFFTYKVARSNTLKSQSYPHKINTYQQLFTAFPHLSHDWPHNQLRPR